MGTSSNGNDPRRFAFWNKQNRERSTLAPFRRRKPRESPEIEPRGAGMRLAMIVFDLFLVFAWFALIILIFYFPSSLEDFRFGTRS